MKNNTSQQYTHEGTIGSRRKKFTFSKSEEGRAHLMTMLTDTYPDKENATIRELACNGRDAQIEEGYDGPLEVTTPEPMDPYLIVQDHGTGMTPSFIDNELLEFGTSTKRNSDDYTGFFGIGSKAPLTLVEQFTFYSVHNGVKTTAHVARGDDGNGGIEIMDTVATDEPNGTRFKIAVDDIDTMRRKVQEFFQWWPEGSVLIDGAEPERPEPYLDLDPWIKAYKTDRFSNSRADIILMGGVPYPVPADLRLSDVLGQRAYVVVEVPMGSVEFTMSRQELRNTEQTLETLDIARGWITQHAVRAMQDQIDRCGDNVEKMVQLLLNHYGHYQFRNSLGFTYKGVEIPFNASVDLTTKPNYTHDKDWDEGFVFTYCAKRGNPRGKREGGRERVTVFQHEEVWVIEGYTNKSLSIHNQKKIDRFIDAKGISPRTTFYLVPKIGFLHPWSVHARTVHWSKIASYKGSSGETGLDEYKMYSTRLVKNHDDEAERAKRRRDAFYRPNPSPEKVTEVPDKGRLIYYSWTDDTHYNPKRFQYDLLGPWILRLMPSRQAYAFPIAKNRWEKFVRENPRAKHISVVLQELIDKFYADLTDKQAMILAGGFRKFHAYDPLRMMGQEDRDKVLDPLLHEAFDVIDVEGQSVQHARDLLSLAARLPDVKAPYVEMPKYAEQLANAVNNRYPFLTTVSFGERKHALDYVNAMYLYHHDTDKEDANAA